jgi:hypothetical protein
MQQSVGHWWEHRWTVALLALLAAVPLIWPPIPPLVDLPGHMGRYRVELDAGRTVLSQFYDFQWSLIGNLGVDLLIIPVSKIFGLELGVKLIALTIPVTTVAALLWIAREVHGRVPPTALFALPLAYGHPFLFGFINFALAMALALLAFALWLRLARLSRLKLRAMLFLPISIVIWVCHTFGWGLLGLLAFSAEMIRQHDRNANWPRAIVNAGLHCLPMIVPLFLMVAWRSGAVSGGTGGWFVWKAKLQWFNMTLRDRWRWFDALSLGLITLLIVFGVRDKRMGMSRNLAVSALVLLIAFLLLPRVVFGSAYADMRLTPFIIAIAVIAIRPRPEASTRLLGTLAMAGLALYATRIVATTASFAMTSVRYGRAMVALDHVPVGARLVSFVGYQCRPVWMTNRMEHLPGMAIVRRRAYSNDQWDLPGAQLIRMKSPDRGYFGADPSQIVTHSFCGRDKWRPIDWSLMNVPRDQFDYVWFIDLPGLDPRLLRGLTSVWRDGNNALYRIDNQTSLKAVP